MNRYRRPPRKKEPIPPPGDDVVSVPPPVDEDPPYDRFCDLILTGGVASGVVYPWAIVELARAYRFRNIGGTSVGAMAAALAAAAEYGRRTGFEAPFEVLRRSPADLAKTLPDGRTRMLSLFQPNQDGRRLIWLWGKLGRGKRSPSLEKSGVAPHGGKWRVLGWVLRAYWWPVTVGATLGALVSKEVAWSLGQPLWEWTGLSIALIALVTLLSALFALVHAVCLDIQYGLIKNRYGLCKGGAVAQPGSEDQPSGLSDWLHDGIQRSAGLKVDDRPLTFRDLWNAPAYPGAARRPCGPDDPPDRRAINLQMITTNATHGRPYRLPLNDKTSRLFFRRDELEGYFPSSVLDAMVASARPYAPRGRRVDLEPVADASTKDFLELSGEDFPLVVAARMSLSFPLLFSAVPLWAIDYEAPPGSRTLRRCLFTDGGVSSNFPIHLFDAAMPRWPTFGFWLDRHPPFTYDDGDNDVWLPRFHGQGRGDNWNRFDPASRRATPVSKHPVDGPDQGHEPAPSGFKADAKVLFGYLVGVATSATNWRDRTSFRLPHVRNRVARLMLRKGEGALNIGMQREQILMMAHRYGTRAGQEFVNRFKDLDGKPSQAWREQRWIRFNMFVNGLRERFDGFTTSAAWSAHTLPLRQAIAAATQEPGPIEDSDHSHKIDVTTAASLVALLHEFERLEDALKATPSAFDGQPEPELRLRPPL